MNTCTILLPDEPHPEDGGHAGHLRVGVRPGRRYRQGLRHGGGRLRGQALLADEACGKDQGGAAQAGRIDYAGHRVAVAGRPVRLTPTEYALLFELSVHAGRVLTHDQLLHRVWGPERTGEPWLVREVVKRLRRKLGDDANSLAYIFTEPRARGPAAPAPPCGTCGGGCCVRPPPRRPRACRR